MKDLAGLAEVADGEIKVNLLGLLDYVGRDDMTGEEATAVVNVLVGACRSDNLEVILEGLNCFFDIFCDERYDQFLGQVVEMMKSGVSHFQRLVNKERDQELKKNGKLALKNLRAFIQYKEENMRV